MGSRATTHLKDLCLVYSFVYFIHMGCYSYMNAIIIVDFVHVSNWKVAMQQFHSLCWSNWKPFYAPLS